MLGFFGAIYPSKSAKESFPTTPSKEEDRKSSIESFDKDSSWRKSFDDHGITDSSWIKSYDDNGITDSYWPVSYFDKAASEELSLQSQRQSILDKAKYDALDVVQEDYQMDVESELVLENETVDDITDTLSNSNNDINLEDHISIEELIMTEEVLNEILEADEMYMQSGGDCFDNVSGSSSDHLFSRDGLRKRSSGTILMERSSSVVSISDIISLQEMIMTEEVLNEILEADSMFSRSGGDFVSIPSSDHAFFIEDFTKRSGGTLLKGKETSLLDVGNEDTVSHSVYFSDKLEDFSDLIDNHSDRWKNDPTMNRKNFGGDIESSNFVTQSVPVFTSSALIKQERSPIRKASIESVSVTSRSEIVAALVSSFANLDPDQDSNVQLEDTSEFHDSEVLCVCSNEKTSVTNLPSIQSFQTTAREEDLQIEEEKSIQTTTNTLFLSEDQHAWLSAEEFEFFFGFPLHAFHHIIRGSYE